MGRNNANNHWKMSGIPLRQYYMTKEEYDRRNELFEKRLYKETHPQCVLCGFEEPLAQYPREQRYLQKVHTMDEWHWQCLNCEFTKTLKSPK